MGCCSASFRHWRGSTSTPGRRLRTWFSCRGTTAARRLASLIAELPDTPSTLLAPGANAARLMAQLPRRIGLTAPSAAVSSSVSIPAVMQSRTFHYAAFVLMVVVLGSLGIVVSQRSATAVQVHDVDAPTSSTVAPSIIPTTSGR
jgi:hypothetical protein